MPRKGLMKHHPILILPLVLLLVSFAGGPGIKTGRAQTMVPAPQQIARARISVPPAPAPASLVLADGFDGLASAGDGVYYVTLEQGLAFGESTSLACTGAKPGVTCSAELIAPDAGELCTNLVVYRHRWQQPEDGDVWILAVGVEPAS